MKNFNVIQLLFLFLFATGFNLQSQCSFVNNSSANQTTIPAGCYQFLADFIPHSTDPALQINVQVWLFNETNGTGLWSSNTIANANAMIIQLNSNFSSLQPPNHVVSGVANIQDSKIRFVLKGFQAINNSTYFHNPAAAHAQYYDSNALNIYFIEDPLTNTGPAYPIPQNHFPYNSDPLFTDIGNLPFRNLDHELCHCLGLEHTWLVPAWDFNGGTFSNTNETCCPTLAPNDYHQEYWQNPGVYTPGDEWALQGACNSLGPKHSNNIMGYNNYCRNYLSPLQMAMMHYHLRTHLTQILTNTSYNNDLVRNQNLDYVVQNGTGGETWTTNRYFKGNITVKSGNKLEILCKVGMAQNTHIIVEKGAQLVIGAGGELTNISCQYWGGISVQGSTNLPQIVNGTTGFAVNQGVVRVINGGKISNAENGIKNYTTFSNGNIDWSSRGGVIVGNGGVFENNVRDIEFISYHNSWGNDYSTFTNCQFLTTKNSLPYPFVHVTLWDVKGVQFKGCNFE